MADDTPDTPAEAKPAPRRRAPRKTPARQDAAPKADTAREPEPEAATSAPARRPRKAATPRPTPPAPKPRSTKRATPQPTRRAKEAGSPAQARTGGSVGSGWGKAAIAGGLAAVGAVATAALLSLRGSTPRPAAATTKRDATGGEPPAVTKEPASD